MWLANISSGETCPELFFFFVFTESFAEQKFKFDEVSLISFSFYGHYFFGVRSKTFPRPRLQRFSIFFFSNCLTVLHFIVKFMTLFEFSFL